MKILIDTSKKTLKLEGSVKFEELMKFVEDNYLKDYSILPDTITVKEKEYYPYYPSVPWNVPNPIYPTAPYYEPYRVTCEDINVPSVFHTSIN